MKKTLMFAVAAVLTFSQCLQAVVPVFADETGDEELLELTDMPAEADELEGLTENGPDLHVLEDGDVLIEDEPATAATDGDFYSADGSVNAEDLATKQVSDYKLFWSNVNSGAVYNGPTKATTFTVPKGKTLRLDAIGLYHYNYGAGKAPGKITLKKGKTKIGSWTAKGRYYNQWWDVFPNKKLSAGTYTITCSSNATWSYNGSSGYAGFAEVYGKYTSGDKLGKPVITSIKYINKTKTVKNYKIRWSKVKGAKGYEIQASRNKNFKKIIASCKTSKCYCTFNRDRRSKKPVYQRVRAYKKSGSKTVYGPWSKKKKIK